MYCNTYQLYTGGMDSNNEDKSKVIIKILVVYDDREDSNGY